MDGRAIAHELEAQRLSPEQGLAALAGAVHDAPTSTLRLDACAVLGSLAGRAYGASWDVAERAAFVLLEVARDADRTPERARLLSAMGRAFRNAWLVPYVHARLGDEDPHVVAAAISAAGGLGFPALEAAIASHLDDETQLDLRIASIAALGRMGAESSAARIALRISKNTSEATAALCALTEMRSRAGEQEAIELLAGEPPSDVLVAAARYLAELGAPGVLPALRRMAREGDPGLRITASLASRAFRAETAQDSDERLLAALTERDRAVRSALARRLRTLPVGEVLAHAELLLSDDPEGVVQVLAEVRAPEVTRRLLALAQDTSASAAVRARAAGSIEADEPWERDALLGLIATCREAPVRVAAVHAIGAFAPLEVVLDRLGGLADAPEPALRGALLWALQLAAYPRAIAAERARAEAIVRRLLADDEPVVRRRAAYVAGNLDASSLVPDLCRAVQAEGARADIRIACFVALAEIGAPDRVLELVHAFNREEDPVALGAAARALERSGAGERELARARDRLPKLLASEDPRVRAAAVRVAGLMPRAFDAGAIDASAIVELARDPAPRVREQATTALSRLGAEEMVAALTLALDDVDPLIQERAAEGLLSRERTACTARVLELVSRTPDHDIAMRLAARIALPDDAPAELIGAIGDAIERVGPEHAAYELLLDLKIRALERLEPAPRSEQDVDVVIASLFPKWPRLSAVRGFAPLARSLRTAETLYRVTGETRPERGAARQADESGPIVLWAKCLEGYLHAWLSPRLGALQQKPSALFGLVDKITGSGWPAYQRWLGSRWADPVDVGGLSIELPLRSAINALRDLSEHRLKSLSAPLAITEWARMMLFLAVDHPAGPRNVLAIACEDPERAVELSHRLQVLAQVRNTVTHRSVASRATLESFRALYYPTFEALTEMA